MNKEIRNEIEELLFWSLEGDISEEQAARLNQLLLNHTERIRYAVQYLQIASGVKRSKGVAGMSESLRGLPTLDAMGKSLSQLIEMEKLAPAVVTEGQERIDTVCKPKPNETSSGKSIRFWLFTTLVASAALLLILLLPFVLTQSQEVATLVDSMDVEWFEPRTPMVIGSRLQTEHPLRIQKGIIKLEFDEGTSLIVEGPATFQLTDSNRVTLQEGFFSALVPESAIGFTVQTRTSRIVDLGTEFGVKVQRDGTTSTHMFKGKASMVATTDGSLQTPFVLAQGQAKQMDVTGEMSDIPFEDRTFVRELDSEQGSVWRGETIDLVDIYWGGDGRGNGAGEQAALMSSPLMELPAVVTEAALTDVFEPHVQAGDPCYFSVPHPCIDGVFIPDGGHGAVQVSSLGHTYDCPDTRGITWKWAYSRIATNIVFGDRERGRVEYEGPSNEKYIVLHSNIGLTFDLNALSRIYAKTRAMAFRTRIGMSRHFLLSKRDRDNDPHLDITILEDGQERLSIKGLGILDESRELSLPLGSGSRFLTLMVTEGEDHDIDFDYGIFADAQLILKHAEL